MSLTVLIPDMDEAEYHAHPALSASGAKKLLPPSCPALFKYDRDHGQAPKAAFDFGHAAHAAVLGIGADRVVIDADNWTTKAAKQQRDEARSAGLTPLLREEARQVDAMADAIAAHPIAGALFDPDRGQPEVSIFWSDAAFGVERRARLDWLPDAGAGRLVVADLKTTVSAEPGAIAKAVANFGYSMQAAWYLEAVRQLGADDPAFVFVFIEKTAPHLITVAELDTEALAYGAARNARALEVFAECSATDTWPGYSDDIELVSLPAWAMRDHLELT